MENMATQGGSLFRSFWLGGFESACQKNKGGQRVDMISTTQHDQRAEEDYANLKEVGILAARDGIRWHRVDQLNSWDFSSFLPMLQAANRQEIQVIWTLCHYRWPEGLDLLSAAFVKRFAQYCEAV